MNPADNRGPLSPKLARRSFLESLPAAFLTFAGASSLPADDISLHILKADDIERLRLDFNASRSKVRLLFFLSPT